jgi:hypothetical protein
MAIKREDRMVELKRVALGLWVVAICAGCGSEGPELGEVTGIVTLDGKPLPTVEVVFQPQAGGRPSAAYTDKEGRFTMVYTLDREGVLLGTQEVFLRPVPSAELAVNPELTEPPSRFPRKYTQVFETVEVKPGQNEFKFELTSQE